jgi:RimJ/RimL family protein N-acetyltransferase
MNPVHRITKIFRALLVRRSLKEFLHLAKVILLVREQQLVYAVELSQISPERLDLELNPYIRKGETKDLTAARKNHPDIWEFHCDEFDGVQDFFIYEEGGDILNICWIYRATDRNRLLRLQADECEVKFVLTLPAGRGKGIYPAVSIAMQDYLRQEHFRRLFACIVSENTPSIRAHEKAGFRLAGKLVFFKVLGIQLSRRFPTSKIV